MTTKTTIPQTSLQTTHYLLARVAGWLRIGWQDIRRKAAGLDGFKYSKATKQKGEEGLVRNDETITAFLAKPRAYVQGTKMSYPGLKKAKDEAAMVEYLKKFSK